MSAQNNSAPTWSIFMKNDIWEFLEICEKIKVPLNLTWIQSTLREDQYTCLIISRSIQLGLSNFSDKLCRENQNTNFIFNNFSKIMPCVKILQNIACWIPKAINTHWIYAISIAFPWQQWLHERNSTLRYTYIASLF